VHGYEKKEGFTKIQEGKLKKEILNQGQVWLPRTEGGVWGAQKTGEGKKWQNLLEG